jgi:hypothetical protein
MGLDGSQRGTDPPQLHASEHTDGTDDIQTATTAQKGIVSELATVAEAAAGTDSGRVVTPSLLPVLVQDSKYVYAADAGASDTYAITLTPAPSAYATGQVFHFYANTANTGAATLNVNALGAKTIKKLHDQDLADNDIEAGQIVTVIYDGTNFQMQSQVANAAAAASHGISAHTAHGNWKLLYTDGSGDEQELALPADGSKLVGYGVAAAPQFEIDYETINFIIDGGGSTITTGIKGDVQVDFKGTIVAWSILPDQSGSIVIDIWKDTYANFPPTNADAMPGAGKEPTLTATTKAQDTDITDWTTDDFNAGDILRFNVDSVTTCTRVTLALKCKRLLNT